MRILTALERVAVWHDPEGRVWHHRTDAELFPGDVLLPAARRGHRSQWEGDPDYDPNYVYYYDSRAPELKLDPSPHGKYTYEVRPVGRRERDPEFAQYMQEYYGSGTPDEEVPGYYSYRSPVAQIIRRL